MPLLPVHFALRCFINQIIIVALQPGYNADCLSAHSIITLIGHWIPFKNGVILQSSNINIHIRFTYVSFPPLNSSEHLLLHRLRAYMYTCVCK